MSRVLIHLIHYTVTLLLFGLLAGTGLLLYFSHDLPDHNQLANYHPSTVTRVYASDGRLIEEFATEHRIFVPIDAIPKLVIHAFLAAEDRNFYSHAGVDAASVARAAITNIRGLWNKDSLQGGSTITQQVAKNMLLSRERTLIRKVKEAILAFRMDQAFSKDRIMELYLNEIYLGAGSYGVAAAALNYFNKSIDELSIQEAALLAAMPKAPSVYDPRRNYDKALSRRNWIIRGMAEEGYINENTAELAITSPIELHRRKYIRKARADYFTEEVRRRLMETYGETKLYRNGFSVHSTLDLGLQSMAEQALREGLVAYDKRQGYRGALDTLDNLDHWKEELALYEPPAGIGDWHLAVVLKAESDRYHIGLKDGSRGFILFSDLAWAQQETAERLWKKRRDILRLGDIILVVKLKGGVDRYALRQMPQINGAMVVMDPHTGRVLAMTGGFDYELSTYNRATQAKRQPGSAFKPFVYLTALEAGYTPAHLIADEPIEFPAGNSDAEDEEDVTWAPQNYSGNFYGPTTLRRGVEKSLNVMTVHLGLLLGVTKVAETAKKFGLSLDTSSYLSAVLGTTEVTLLELTNAYAMLVNGGKRIAPALVERIQDRNGKTIYRRDNRPCESCTLDRDSEKDHAAAIPELPDTREQVVDARIAYQMVSILEGVVQRGTAKAARALNRPIAGKTGTTNNSIDAWFIGFSPDIVVSVYVGYDAPRSLGEKAEGATVALPIFIHFMQEALKAKSPVPFRIPPGIRLVRIDAKTGFLPSQDTPSGDIILEAFLPGTEPTQFALRNRPLPVINTKTTYSGNSDQPEQKAPDVPVIRGTGSIY